MIYTDTTDKNWTMGIKRNHRNTSGTEGESLSYGHVVIILK